MNEAYLSLLFNNMRQPLERRGDFNAMYGTGRKAVEHVQRLCRRFGKKDLLEAIDEILARSETVMRSRIQALEDGDYYAEGFMESTGTSPEPLVLRLKLSVKGDRPDRRLHGNLATDRRPHQRRSGDDDDIRSARS